MSIRKFGALVLAILLAGNASAQEIQDAPPIVEATPALWVVSDDDTTIYLFGTIHILKDNINWFNGGVRKAFDASSEVVLEVDNSNVAAVRAAMAKYAVDPDGPALTQKLGPELSAKYRAAMANAGLPLANFETMEPWVLPLVLSVSALERAGYSGDNGVEAQIAIALRNEGKRLGTLETIDQQLRYFDTLPEAAQIALLRSTIESLDESGRMMDRMLNAWTKGDPDTLAALMNTGMDETPELAKTLLYDRNVRWAEWIEQRLAAPGTVFVAVGAGHLAGKQSVQAQLDLRKLRAIRIPF